MGHFWPKSSAARKFRGADHVGGKKTIANIEFVLNGRHNETTGVGKKFPLSISPRTAELQSPGVQQGPGCGQNRASQARTSNLWLLGVLSMIPKFKYNLFG